MSSTAPVEPVSRRARRAQTGEQQIIASSVATAETVATTTPPTVAEPAQQERQPAHEPQAEQRPAGDAASTWMVETLARLMAAEASATAPLVEQRPTETSFTASPETAAEPHIAAEPQVPAEPQPATEPVILVETKAVTEPVILVEPAPAAPTAELPGPARTQRPRTERVESQTSPTAEAEASGVDEFEAAARLFAFTGQNPVQEPAATEAEAEVETEAKPTPKHTAPRRAQRGSAFKRVATASFSVGVFGIVGLMAVGMTTPAEAVAAVSGAEEPLSVLVAADPSVPAIDEDEIQAYVAPGDAQVDALDRNASYATVSTAQLASEAGIRNFANTFRNNPNSNVQWPFAVGVPISYGFGMRPGGMHRGVDFTPGSGAPIQAIADGTVRIASEAGGEFGVHVMIDHVIDGQLVSSHYAHMQYGSLAVTQGEHVTAGQLLGRTGNTGRSYGAHTHFEILQNGTTRIDPMPWLRTYTDGTHTVG